MTHNTFLSSSFKGCYSHYEVECRKARWKWPKCGAAVAQWVELVDWWSEGRWFESRLPMAGLSYMSKYPWARYWTPKLLLMCSWHLVEVGYAISKGPAMSWRLIQDVPCPSRKTGFGPSKPRNPLGGKMQQHPATLTESGKKTDGRTKWPKFLKPHQYWK